MSKYESDTAEIEQVLYRYAWMVDQRKWNLKDDVFAPGGTIDYATTGGPGATEYSKALAWLDEALTDWPINLHHITNITVDIDGDSAKSRCYFTAPMGRKEQDGSSTFITNAGYYLDDLRKIDGKWLITKRYCDMTVQIGTLPEGHSIPDLV